MTTKKEEFMMISKVFNSVKLIIGMALILITVSLIIYDTHQFITSYNPGFFDKFVFIAFHLIVLLFTLLGIVLVVSFFLSHKQGKAQSVQIQKDIDARNMQESMLRYNNFVVSRKFNSCPAVLFDDMHNQFAIIYRYERPQFYRYSDILSFELLNKDKVSINNGYSQNYCALLSVKITLNCIANPCIIIDFLKDNNGNYTNDSFKNSQQFLSVLAYIANKTK